jgi:hypothetical protein
VYKAKDAGFVVGAIVYEKKVGVLAGLYDVTAIDADGAKLEECKLGRGDAAIATVEIGESANVELAKRTVDGVAMPIYVNKRMVNQFERLAVYKPKVVAKRSAKTVTTVEKAKRARVE